MKDEVSLLLTVYEGEGIPPKDGWSLVVSAQLDCNVQSCDPVPLTSYPVFNTEVSWDLSPTTLRKLRQNKVPLKVECKAMKGSLEKRLGSVVLPLNTAVLGIKTDSKWHKLLDGVPGPHKIPPAIKLSLNVVSANASSKKDEISDDEGIMEVEPPSHRSPSRDLQFLRAINSLSAGQDITVVSSGKKLSLGKKKEKFDEDNDVSVVKGRYYNRATKHATGSRFGIRSSEDDIQEILNWKADDINDVVEVGDIDEVREMTTPRRSARVNLHSMNRSARRTTSRSPSPISHRLRTPRSNHSTESSSVSAKRKSWRDSDPCGSGDVSSPSPVKENGLPAKRQRLRSAMDEIDDTVLALPGPSTSRSSVKPTQVVARLNEKGGFFQIGPAGEPDEQTFHFAVTIVYAKYLDQVMPSDLNIDDGTGVKFCYSLLGHVVYTDQIKDLTNPDFPAERAGGKVLATATNVSQYFTQHPQLPIHLMMGDVVLAICSIDLEQFGQDVLRGDGPMVVEGQHPLIPVITDPMNWSPDKQPIIGVTVTLTVTPKEEPSSFPSSAFRDAVLPSASVVAFDSSPLSNSSSSDSEDEWMNVPGSSSQGFKKSVVRAGRKLSEATASWRHKRKKLVYDAAMEVEMWKEGQQQAFWQQWSAREAELQRHLSEEWEERVSRAEMHLHQRLDQCQTLHRRLTESIASVDAKERSISLREERARVQEEKNEHLRSELKSMKREFFDSPRRRRQNCETVDIEMTELRHELTLEKLHRRDLKRQVRELEADNEVLNRALNASKLGTEVKNEEIEALKREKDRLFEQLSETEKRKQHYKMQWVKATSQLHQVLTEKNQYQSQDLRRDYSPPPSVSIQYHSTTTPTKSLKYKEENHVDQRRTTRSLRLQNSEVQVKTEKDDHDHYKSPSPRKKDNRQAKNTDPKQTLADAAERQELVNIMRRSGSLETNDNPVFVQDAMNIIRGLDR